MLKWLVGLASVAIIAAVAYYFWGEWQEAEAAKAAELAALEVARANCLAVRDDLQTVLSGGNLGRRFVQVDAKSALRLCVAGGTISDDDLNGISLEF